MDPATMAALAAATPTIVEETTGFLNDVASFLGLGPKGPAYDRQRNAIRAKLSSLMPAAKAAIKEAMNTPAGPEQVYLFSLASGALTAIETILNAKVTHDRLGNEVDGTWRPQLVALQEYLAAAKKYAKDKSQKKQAKKPVVKVPVHFEGPEMQAAYAIAILLGIAKGATAEKKQEVIALINSDPVLRAYVAQSLSEMAANDPSSQQKVAAIATMIQIDPDYLDQDVFDFQSGMGIDTGTTSIVVPKKGVEIGAKIDWKTAAIIFAIWYFGRKFFK